MRYFEQCVRFLRSFQYFDIKKKKFLPTCNSAIQYRLNSPIQYRLNSPIQYRLKPVLKRGDVSIISSEPTFVEWEVSFTTVPFIPLTDQGWRSYPNTST